MLDGHLNDNDVKPQLMGTHFISYIQKTEFFVKYSVHTKRNKSCQHLILNLNLRH